MVTEQLVARGANQPEPVITPLQIRGRIARPQPKGLPIINLSFNEMPYGPSEGVGRAIAEASFRANRYGDPSCKELRHLLGERNGLPPDRIICGNGSEELLDIIGRVFARPGDEIVISQYGYIQFPIVANRVGANLVRAPENDLTSSVDSILATVTENTKIVFLANPNNPTGTMIELGELERLANGLSSSTVLVVDLAYGEFAGPDYCSRVQALAENRDNVITTRTFSKAYGLAGLRVGWCHAPEWMVPPLYAARGMGTVNALAQAAAIAALNDEDLISEQVSEIVSERDRVAGELAKLNITAASSRSNFLLAQLPGKPDPITAGALVEFLFDEAGILINRTRETGLEKYVRFSLSLREHNDQLVEKIAEFIHSSEVNP